MRVGSAIMIAWGASLTASFQTEFDARLNSLSASHELLARQNWQSIPIADLVRSQLAFVNGHDATQIAIEGPALQLSASLAEYLGLALHELATNAMKHGALSVPGGKIHVVWTPTKPSDDFSLIGESGTGRL